MTGIIPLGDRAPVGRGWGVDKPALPGVEPVIPSYPAYFMLVAAMNP